MNKKVLYSNGNENFVIGVDEELYNKIINSRQPGRKNFTFLIEDVKTKTQQLIDSKYILLQQ